MLIILLQKNPRFAHHISSHVHIIVLYTTPPSRQRTSEIRFGTISTSGLENYVKSEVVSFPLLEKCCELRPQNIGMISD